MKWEGLLLSSLSMEEEPALREVDCFAQGQTEMRHEREKSSLKDFYLARITLVKLANLV